MDDGFNHYCKKCEKEKGKSYYKKHSVYMISVSTKWNKEHRELSAKHCKDWRNRNPAKVERYVRLLKERMDLKKESLILNQNKESGK